jgi:ketosteroid isomerase-like protein
VPETNVETFRRMLEAFNRGGVGEILEFFDDDVEVYDPDLPDDGAYRGKEALRRLLEQMLDGTEHTQVWDYELVPAGDRVVALTHTYARGEGGGPEVEMRDAHTMTFRDGKIVYWRLYLDRKEALADVGLSHRDGAGPDGSGPDGAGPGSSAKAPGHPEARD